MLCGWRRWDSAADLCPPGACRHPASCRDRQYGWPPDPVWTESNWPLGTPALTLFLREAPGTEWALLGAGLAVTAASVAGALWVQWAHQRKLKRQ